jgi:hypothetical protein
MGRYKLLAGVAASALASGCGGMTDGRDVRELNSNLAALGYGLA